MLVPGRSLGGIELGATKAEVERRWGRAYGVCRGCATETWYFNYFAFQPRGAGVELREGPRRGRVHALPAPGLADDAAASRWATRWRASRSVYGALVRRECGGYAVLVLPGRGATTAFYVLDDRLWAFGLFRPGLPLCR